MELSPNDAADKSGKAGDATRTKRGKQSAAAGQNNDKNENRSIVVGKIASPFGVQGWTKVLSYTEPTIGLLDYPIWQLNKLNSEKSVKLQQGRQHGKFLVVKFEGIDDRDEVARLTNSMVVVTRDQFPDADQNSYYWADLIGLKVTTTLGVDLGTVDSLLETGANDVLVVKGEKERLVPWIQPDVIREVNLTEGAMVVDWDPDF